MLQKPPVKQILAATLLALASAAPAAAQCYQFTGSGATLKVLITGFNIVNPPVTAGGGKFASYVFSSINSFTAGSTTQTSTSTFDGTIAIQYLPPLGDTPGITTFQIVVPNATPGKTGNHDWQAVLNGAGDLLPTGLVNVLPPLGVWFVPPPSKLSNYVEADEGTAKIQYPMTAIGQCSAADAADLNKSLGLTCSVPGCVSCGEPIDIGSGNVFDRIEDYETAGPNKLDFTRYYNSLAGSATYAVRLGVNWRSSYDRYLRLTSTSVTAERADGRQLTFNQSNGAWVSDSDVDYTLTNTGSTWTLTDPEDTVETYTAINSSEGLLQTIRARGGYTRTMHYDSTNQLTSVTDSYSRQLSLTYANGRLAQLNTPDGVIFTYGYTGNRLTSISYNTTPVTSQTYLYENTALPNALTGIVDENGNRYVTWTYDSTGRGLSSSFAGGAGLLKIAYNDSDRSRTVTNALGQQTMYKFSVLQNMPKVTEIDRLGTSTTAAAVRKFTYDSKGYTATSTDWNGNVTSYTNDAHGRPTTIVKASGTPQAVTTAVTYHPTFHLTAKVVEAGLTTAYTYDSVGQLLTKTLTDTTTATSPYSTNGQARTWTYTWSNFLPASVQNPRTDVADITRFSYDSSGALTATTNAMGQTTRITQHLPGGLPQTIVDSNGVSTQVTYDARLRPVSTAVTTAAGVLTTTYAYDAAGNRTGVTLPDGSSVTTTFDAAHRITGIADLTNQSATLVLDALDNRTKSSLLDAAGTVQRTRSGVFDALGRPIRDVRGANQTSSYTYDSNGNTLTITDPLNRVTQRSYDALDRATRITDAAKGVTTTAYDAHDRPVTVTDPNGAVTSFVYDGFGEIIQRVNPDSGTTVYRYDADGNIVQTVNGAGAVVNHTYDALDRILTTTYPGDPSGNVAYTYDEPAAGFGIGRLTSVTDAAGTLSRSYDERGNLLGETRVNGSVALTTAYTYDGANRVSSIRYPSGWIVSYTRDLAGRAAAISAQSPDGSATVPVVMSAGYQPFGPVNALSFGNGVNASRSFDSDYRVTGLSDAGANPVQSLTYTFDAADNVSAIADGVNPGNSQTFSYDALNRLTAATGSYGSYGYTYDAVGNRLTFNQGGSTINYSYTTRSNQLVSLSADGVGQSVTYEKSGAINGLNPAVDTISNLTYNDAGRLASVTAPGGQSVQYTYDASGRRLAKNAAATTLYQYDRGGRLLEETDGQGSPLADYIYLDDLPVATLSPANGQVYFLHTDRLGTPQIATDAGQTVVWSAGYAPFGEMSTTPSLIVQNLRMPGQEFDADTGLYHNGYRDYAPAWGRYLQPDPLSIVGGLNTYSYADANPVNRTDPLGLLTWDDVKQTFTDLSNKVADDYDIAKAQVQTLMVLGPSQYFASKFPEAHQCLAEVEAEAKKLWEDSAPLREIKELYDDVEEALEGSFLPWLGWGQKLFQYGSQQQDWGDRCGSCAKYGGAPPLNLGPPPAPQPAPPTKK